MSDNKPTVKPTFTIQGKNHTMNIGIGTVRALDCPSYITLLKGIEQKTIAVTPCDAKHTLSFKVPSGFIDRNSNVKFTIKSKAFIEDIMKYCGLELESTYVFKGEYDESHNRVVFQINGDQTKISKKPTIKESDIEENEEYGGVDQK